jgi:CBS domain-containing protein
MDPLSTKGAVMKMLDQALPDARKDLGLPTARDVMTPNPVSIRHDATISEAATFLTEKGIRAAPVIDQAGRPVGVLSSTDILIHLGQGARNRRPSSQSVELSNRAVFTEDGFRGDRTRQWSVRDIMTPEIFCVRAETPAAKLNEKLTGLKVRRLFVVDHDNVLIGVVSAFDVLQKLKSSCFGDE